jgi:hypothetical protein
MQGTQQLENNIFANNRGGVDVLTTYSMSGSHNIFISSSEQTLPPDTIWTCPKLGQLAENGDRRRPSPYSTVARASIREATQALRSQINGAVVFRAQWELLRTSAPMSDKRVCKWIAFFILDLKHMCLAAVRS